MTDLKDNKAQTDSGISGEPLKILLADDEEVVRLVAVEVLAAAGYEVFEAADGRQAVELFGRFVDEWGGVVLDLGLPKLSGDKVYEHIVAHRPDLPVILATGFSEEEVRERLRGKPVAGILHKPFPCDQLLDLVMEKTACPSDKPS